MQSFNYRDGELYVEGLSARALAAEFDTPCYVYSRAALEGALNEYQQALEGIPHLVCYAVKANSNLAVLEVLARQGAGFDIVSVGELERVLAAGGDPAKVVFSGVAKKASEMARALEVGIHCFNLESAAELEVLNQVATEMDKVAPISVRVNPDVDARTHPYISTGLKENKFGVTMDEALRMYQRGAELPNIDIQGLDCHIGSQLTELSPFIDAIERQLSLVDQLQSQGITIHHLDIGGGLGVRYRDETPPSIASYIEAVRTAIGDRPLQLVLEPGRSIAANAGILLTRVEYTKQTPERNFALIDAAMNDMIRPALYQAWLDIKTVSQRSEGEVLDWDLVGPVCETADFLGKERPLNIEAGELLSVFGAGAYGFVMSSNYNTRGRAAEVLVDGERAHLARERETIEELLRLEHRLPADS
ncbi:diaminopimelate decarboxylase [Parahaliea sp. F7430]|uniref:Diaminopimelate decarboxylase n=1 Tax=Sediminihaliea albiluteola TaxID=2758564 RepID=A0A7W2TWL2_9GAMM|nr:diaminopimelate decarboxylase [Sediminihaliea albiluteola]MBA6413288.1 diaminopimelate decarboxylase [Sediminihaliea albiluteola]